MITRVLFIDSDSRALARIKKALEQAGAFEASVFVTGLAALEHAADQPPALVVVALNLTDIAPLDLIRQLRAIVPGLPVILRAPTDTDRHIVQTINAYEVVEGGYSARTLIPLLNDALQSSTPAQPKAPSSAPVPPLSSIMPTGHREPSPRTGHPDDDMTDFDAILDSIEPNLPQAEDDSFHLLVESMRSEKDRPSLPRRHERLVKWAADGAPEKPEPQAQDVFEQLSAEEPPLPELQDSGTVSDLIATTDFRQSQAEDQVADIPEDMILLDFDDLSETDEQRDLLKALSAMDQPPSREIDLETLPERLAAPPPTPPSSNETEPAPLEGAAQKAQMSLADLEPPATKPARVRPARAEDEAAAMALELTEQTLDSAAQASVLVRGSAIVASAGQLAASDLIALVEMVDCERVLEEQVTKLKLVSLPDLHLSYMVVAAPTVDNMVLLTIFPENMQLGAIRNQARNIMRAMEDAGEAAAAAAEERAAATFEAESQAPETLLSGTFAAQTESTQREPARQSAPEKPSESAPLPAEAKTTPDIDRDGLVSYACAWLLRDPAGELPADLTEVLSAWLHQIAADHDWYMDQMEIQPDYVSVVIEIGADDTPAQMADTLMSESARKLTAARPDLGTAGLLWADAYYIVAPGRPLTVTEISQFMSYQRQH